MNQLKSNWLLSFLILLITGGVLFAVAGVYVMNETSNNSSAFDEYHDVGRSEINIVESKSTIFGSKIAYYLQEDHPGAVAASAEHGITVGELMRMAGIVAIVAALLILILIEFVFKDRINQMNYRMLLIISLFVLPVIVGLGTSATVLETTKSVESCGSCHVMDPFVNDLSDPGSTTLAARHYKNRWISEYQCYTCHTTYGAHGTFEGKRDGFRHWLLFVTQTWDEPISYSGSYPNMNCTACHSGTTAFQQVQSHQALSSKLRADEVSCTSCHGPAHPTPGERENVPAQHTDEQQSAANEINYREMAKLMEVMHELNP